MERRDPSSQTIATNEVEPHPDSRYGVEVLNADNPRSVWNLIDEKFKNALLTVPKYFREMDEKALKKIHKLHPTLNLIRMQFWAEYDAAHARNGLMDMSRVWAGACTREYWYLVVLKKPEWVGWISIPPLNYARKVEEALFKAYERMREILECEPIDPMTGKLNIATARLQMQILKMLEERQLGAVVQKSAQVVFHAAAPAVLNEYSVMSNMDELTRQERQLERQMRSMGIPKEQIVAERLERIETPDITKVSRDR